MYVVEHKSGPRAAWKAIMFVPRFPTLAAAIAQAASLDQDGLITPDVRIRHTIDGVVPRKLYASY